MCYFINLIVPSAAAPALRTILRARGRIVREVHNPSLAATLQPDDRQFLTTKTCDCGTALATAVGADTPATPERDATKLRKLGWSDAKIARSAADRNTARAHRKAEALDSIQMWAEIVAEIFAAAKPERVALFLHFYSGDAEAESLKPSRRRVPEGLPIVNALKTFAEDEVLTFRKPRESASGVRR